jgi:hypothetical protein
MEGNTSRKYVISRTKGGPLHTENSQPDFIGEISPANLCNSRSTCNQIDYEKTR